MTVVVPGQTNFITGGGYLTLGASAGVYKGDSGSRNNFGLNVKYNKAGTNLQGNLNFIVRGGGHIYQFKSNALNNLTISGSPVNTATFTGKANLADVTNPLAPFSLGGNLTMQVQMHDKGEPGAGVDTLGVTVWDSGEGLLFSSNFSSSLLKTIEQTITGGNLQVH